jgi:hypothetical protein
MRKLTLAAVLLALVHTAAAAAESEGDANVAQLHQEHPELGFLFFDVTMLKDSRLNCRPSVILTSNTGKTAKVTVATGSLFSLGLKTKGALASLEPAVWVVTKLDCGQTKYNGSIAGVRIAAGEIVNAGHLVVEIYTVRPEGLFNGAVRRARAKVEDLEPDATESLTKRAPATFAKAKRRYFAIDAALKWVDPAPASPANR